MFDIGLFDRNQLNVKHILTAVGNLASYSLLPLGLLSFLPNLFSPGPLWEQPTWISVLSWRAGVIAGESWHLSEYQIFLYLALAGVA